MTPIRPYTRHTTRIIRMPLIIERLLGRFTRGTRKYRDLASTIFTNSILDKPDFTIKDIPIIITDDNLLWSHPNITFETAQNQIEKYTLFLTVWYRINISQSILLYDRELTQKKNDHLVEKTKIFQNAHCKVAQYLSTLQDPADINIDLGIFTSLYKSPGISYFDDDRDHIQIKKEKYKVCETPLEVIERQYPNVCWRLENVKIRTDISAYASFNPIISSIPDTHSVYFKCLTIMLQCQEYYEINKDDNLYFYYVAFLDLFRYCLYESTHAPRMDDVFLNSFICNTNITVLEFYYPHDTRVFTCWDLPDLYSVLIRIPLHGVQQVAQTLVQSYIQKSLPFCCQRRTLVKEFIKSLNHNDGMSIVIRKLFWCLLANMYPDTKKTFDMQRLIRAHEISSNIDMLKYVFERPFAKPVNCNNKRMMKDFDNENNKGCSIIMAAFQAWMYAITYNNPQYGQHVKKYIDWNMFTKQIIETLEFLQTIDIFKTDVFDTAREQIEDLPFHKEMPVYRYKKDYQIDYILKYVREALEKNVFQELAAWRKDKRKLESLDFNIKDIEKTVLYDNFTDRQSAIECCEEKIRDLETEIPCQIKQNILNVLLHVPLTERMSVNAISLLRLEEYGGLTEETITIFLGMIDVYNNITMPRFMKEFVSFVGSVYALKVICWYLTIVGILNNIKVLPLDATTVQRIDHAMRYKKYKDGPSPQHLSKNMYDVFITICCQNINTLFGDRGYGHKDMCFNLETRRFTCAKSSKKYDEDGISSSSSSSETKSCKKDFTSIPCKNTPVLKIPLRGLQLIYDGKRYMHCPNCAGFHEYKWTNWSGAIDGRYRCENCKNAEPTQILYYKCAHCKTSLTSETARKHTLQVMSKDEISKRLYYCRKHFKIAKKYVGLVFEEDLEKKIKQREEKNNVSGRRNKN